MTWSRKIILGVAQNRTVSSFVQKYGMQLGAKRFVASLNLGGALDEVIRLRHDGFCTTLDHLGESVNSEELASRATMESLAMLNRIHELGFPANISVKLTQLGLDFNENLCWQNIDAIVQTAKLTTNGFVRVDMEDSSKTDITLDFCQRLAEKYGKKHIGVVIQSYLLRSQCDLQKISGLGTNVRFVKGAYRENPSLVFENKEDINVNYLDLAIRHLQNGGYAALATHDVDLICRFLQFVNNQNTPINQDRFEFQMLFGVREQLQRHLKSQGYKVRIYVPYGNDWYHYFSRRIAERPSNAFLLFDLQRLKTGLYRYWRAPVPH